jgi:hypothetical protein
MNELKFSKEKQLGYKAAGGGRTSTRMRRDYMDKKLYPLWSKVVRTRDGYICQHCGSRNHPEAHHVVPRSRCNNIGLFDTRNGVTLCHECHFHWMKRMVREYIAWRDDYLKDHKRKSYKELREIYKVSGMRYTLAELEVLHIQLQTELKLISKNQ